jgi:hypothetical protein
MKLSFPDSCRFAVTYIRVGFVMEKSMPEEKCLLSGKSDGLPELHAWMATVWSFKPLKTIVDTVTRQM